MAGPLGDRLNAALRALESQLSGGVPNPLDLVQLRQLESYLGASKPLTEYSPRTRRRYLAAARRGDQRPNRTEYQRRKERTQNRYGGASPQQVTRIRKLARENERMLQREPLNRDVSLDDDFLAQVATVYGHEFLEEVLREQRASIREWDRSGDETHGPQHVGNRRFFGRDERETRLGRLRGQGIIANTDPLYFYHGRT